MYLVPFLGVKRPGLDVDHAVPLLPIWTIVAASRVNFSFTFTYGISVVSKHYVKLVVSLPRWSSYPPVVTKL